MGRFVQLSKIINASVILSQKARTIIKKVQEHGFKTYQKTKLEDDIVTEADLLIQNTIYYNLKELFPQATIVCEEDQSYID